MTPPNQPHPALAPMLQWVDDVLKHRVGDTTHKFQVNQFMEFPTRARQVSHGELVLTEKEFLPTEAGFTDFLVVLLQDEYDVPLDEIPARVNAINHACKALENREDWAKEPLTAPELGKLFETIHEIVVEFAQNESFNLDPETWGAAHQALLDRMLLAIVYVLAWQPFRSCVQFLYCECPLLWRRMSDISERVVYHDPDEADGVARDVIQAPACIVQRVHCFEGLLVGLSEGLISPLLQADIPGDPDMTTPLLDRWAQEGDEYPGADDTPVDDGLVVVPGGVAAAVDKLNAARQAANLPEDMDYEGAEDDLDDK